MKLLITFLLALISCQNSSNLIPITEQTVTKIVQIARLEYVDAIIYELIFHPQIAQLTFLKLSESSLEGDILTLESQTLKQIQPGVESIQGTTFAYSPDGSLLGIGDANGKITIYSTVSFQVFKIFQASPDIVTSLAFSPDNAYLGATFGSPTIENSGDNTFILLSVSSGESMLSYLLDETILGIYGRAVTFSEDSNAVFLATLNLTTSGGEIIGWRIEDEREIFRQSGCGMYNHQLILESTRGELYCVANQAINRVSVSADTDQKTLIFGAIKVELESIRVIAMHPSEPILAVGYFKKILRPDGGPSSTNEGSIRFYNIETGDELAVLDVPESAITALAFSPDGTLLASGGADGTVRLWGIPAGE